MARLWTPSNFAAFAGPPSPSNPFSPVPATVIADCSIVPRFKRFGTSEDSAPRIDGMLFEPLSQYPDHPGLEEDIRFCAQESVLDVVPRLNRMVDGAAEITAG